MIISQTLEYALRAVVFIGSGNNTPFTTLQISQATKVPQAYLAKVLQSLVKEKIIQSQRGLGGGFILAKEPAKIKILDIVTAVDPIERILTCPLKLKSHGSNLCRLHQQLDDAIALIESTFNTSTIADLINKPTTVKPLCDFPNQKIIS